MSVAVGGLLPAGHQRHYTVLAPGMRGGGGGGGGGVGVGVGVGAGVAGENRTVAVAVTEAAFAVAADVVFNGQRQEVFAASGGRARQRLSTPIVFPFSFFQLHLPPSTPRPPLPPHTTTTLTRDTPYTLHSTQP